MVGYHTHHHFVIIYFLSNLKIIIYYYYETRNLSIGRSKKKKMKYKNLTYKMMKYLAKYLDKEPDKWGYTKNTPEFIELVNKEDGTVRRLNKHECGITRV